MILQVIFDDPFGNHVVEQFRNYMDVTRIVLVTYNSKNIHDVRNFPVKDIIVYATQKYKDLIAQLADYKAVIMHGLFSPIQYDIVRKLPSSVKLAWVLWGAEIFTRKDVYTSYLTPCTRFVYRFKQVKDVLSNRGEKKNEVPMDVLKRVDFLMGSSLELFEEVKAYIGNPNMKHLQYSYFTLERLIGNDLLDKTVNGRNILLGNSDTPDNNHLDIMFLLKRVGVPKWAKIITPLSYGNIWIKRIVFKLGKVLFKSQFYPLLKYMQRQDYNKLVQSCSVFIANHHRPNAFGNTLTALWLGARVYVSKDNVQTKFLQRLGLHVNIIEKDLNKKNPNLFTPLSEYEREDNRRVIMEIYGRDQMRKNIQYIIDILNT